MHKAYRLKGEGRTSAIFSQLAKPIAVLYNESMSKDIEQNAHQDKGQESQGAATPEALNKFKRLIASGLEIADAAERCGFSPNTRRKIVQKLAKDAETELRLAVFESLLNHVQGNASAAIFAAKAKLGWQDKQVIEQNQTVEYVDVPSQESRKDWEARQAKLRLAKS